MLRSIKSPQRKARLLALKITGATPAINEGATEATLVRNSTGSYTLTYAKPFTRANVIVTATSMTSATIIQVSASTATACTILAFAVDGTTPKNAILNILVHGLDAADEV